MALTTTHGDVIPDEVGSIGFHVNVIIEIPKGQSAQSLLETFVENMVPSKGTPSLGSRFGGIYSGRYYEMAVDQTTATVWANDARTAEKIAGHFRDGTMF
ncbi:MAG: hypothetical protein AABX00_00220 [Nanoarchaeota archaeon]